MVADRLTAYLRHELSLPELVDWAENVMMEGDFEEENYETLREIVSRLGVADVKAFGLTWEDCERFLNQLGYAVRVEVVEH
jgi:hypothetical protein